jgi:DNA mismatch repair protein MSH6
MVENENEEDPTKETITFLYKLITGPCPKSYGFNAARLAGLPDQVIRIAHQKAKEFEATNNAIDAFRKIALGLKNNTLCLSTALKLLKF